MVIYGVSADVSIGGMFMAGVIPGLLMAGALMVMVRAIAVRLDLPRHPFPGMRDLWRAFRAAFWALMTPVILFLGLFGGVFSALYILFCLRTLHLPTSLLGVAIASGGVGALMGAGLGPWLARRMGLGPAILITILFAAISAMSITPAPTDRAGVPVLFTAHSIPTSMADGCRYVPQLQESCRLVASEAGVVDWKLVYQSRSGPPTQPWLEPDVCDAIRDLHARGGRQVVIAPIGFISDHMEVLYDLDTEAADLCRELGIEMARAATVGTAPAFVSMVCDLIAERAWALPERVAIGNLPANHDVCPLDCCPAPQRPAPPAGRPA
jgi:hypothetical protein